MTALRTHRRLALFAALVLVQAAIVAGAVVREERFLRTGTEIVLKAAPVDPNDLLRGDYVTLRYEVQNLDALARNAGGNGSDYIYGSDHDVYVVLEARGRYWQPVAVHRNPLGRSKRPAGTIVLRGVVEWSAPFGTEARLRVTYPNLDRYYVPEGKGDLRTLPDVVVVVNGDGSARIKRLEVDGRPWP